MGEPTDPISCDLYPTIDVRKCKEEKWTAEMATNTQKKKKKEKAVKLLSLCGMDHTYVMANHRTVVTHCTPILERYPDLRTGKKGGNVSFV